MLDGNLTRINIAKQHIKYLKADSTPVYYALHQAGPKMRELKTAEILKTLSKKIIEPAHME